MTEPEVRAAGGVVWRPTPAGIEVVVVHRERYDDWSFPKGKLDRTDADEEACARREVGEETGLACRSGEELPSSWYRDQRGRAKRVRWWAMVVTGEGLTRDDEVDVVAWLPVAEAAGRLTYDDERQVLGALVALVGGGGAGGSTRS